MPEAVTLRVAEPSDAGAVASLIAALASDLSEPSTASGSYVADVLRERRRQVLLAERGAAVLGMLSLSFHASLYHGAEACWVDELVVTPEARNQGVGAKLLEQAIQMARARTCTEATLSVMEANTDARRFYERHGFEVTAVLMERHFQPG